MTGRLLTVEDLAALLQVRPRTVRGMCAKGILPYVRVGKLLRFRPDDVDRWVSGNRREARQP